LGNEGFPTFLSRLPILFKELDPLFLRCLRIGGKLCTKHVLHEMVRWFQTKKTLVAFLQGKQPFSVSVLNVHALSSSQARHHLANGPDHNEAVASLSRFECTRKKSANLSVLLSLFYAICARNAFCQDIPKQVHRLRKKLLAHLMAGERRLWFFRCVVLSDLANNFSRDGLLDFPRPLG
jgi:hypothetical protein